MKTIVTVCDVETRRILGKTPWTTNASIPEHGDTFVFSGEEFFVDHRRWEEILVSKPMIDGKWVDTSPAEPALNVTLVVRATGGKTNAVSLSTEAVRGAAFDECLGLLEEWRESVYSDDRLEPKKWGSSQVARLMKKIEELKKPRRVEVKEG